MIADVRNPTHMTVSSFWADLTATLDAHGLTYLLNAQLAKPMLGHPKYAERRRQCRALWLEAELAVLRGQPFAAVKLPPVGRLHCRVGARAQVQREQAIAA